MSTIEHTNNRCSLTIIIPAYNEEEGIGQTLDSLLPVAKQNNFKVIVINDGSTDKTKHIVEGKPVILINHSFNKGYGASIKRGILATDTEYVALYDADGQHDPEDLMNLWKNKGENDMMVGLRDNRSYREWSRKPGKWILHRTANFLAGRKIPDLNSGMRIIKREKIIDKLHLFSDSFSFSTTSTVAFMSLGYNVEYFPITVNKRIGRSTVRQLRHGTSTMMILLRMVVLFNPLKVFLPVSIITFILGISWGSIGFFIASRFPNSALLLAFMGILFFFMGLISDQISTLNKK